MRRHLLCIYYNTSKEEEIFPASNPEIWNFIITQTLHDLPICGDNTTDYQISEYIFIVGKMVCFLAHKRVQQRGLSSKRTNYTCKAVCLFP